MKEKTWQYELQHAVSDPNVLLKYLQLDSRLLPEAQRAAQLFPLKVTHSFLTRMRRGDPADPLLRQVLPIGLEEIHVKEFVMDPLAEKTANPIPGLLHKYYGRVLIIFSPTCGIACRYCFRRHFPYQANRMTQHAWDAILMYIKQDRTIREVILSGGDPLIINDSLFEDRMNQLAKIEHVKTVRIHSRMPIIVPSRITSSLLDGMTKTRLRFVLVVHCNHAQELDYDVAKAIAQVCDVGVLVLNQAVLLKGINDSESALIDLSHRLFDIRILPYYLHFLDKVQGAAHFAVDLVRARSLLRAIREKLPGYLVPRLVWEHSGARSKLPL